MNIIISFVSLRDVERAVLVTSWFYKKMNLFSKFITDDLDEDPTRHEVFQQYIYI